MSQPITAKEIIEKVAAINETAGGTEALLAKAKTISEGLMACELEDDTRQKLMKVLDLANQNVTTFKTIRDPILKVNNLCVHRPNEIERLSQEDMVTLSASLEGFEKQIRDTEVMARIVENEILFFEAQVDSGEFS